MRPDAEYISHCEVAYIYHIVIPAQYPISTVLDKVPKVYHNIDLTDYVKLME